MYNARDNRIKTQTDLDKVKHWAATNKNENPQRHLHAENKSKDLNGKRWYGGTGSLLNNWEESRTSWVIKFALNEKANAIFGCINRSIVCKTLKNYKKWNL